MNESEIQAKQGLPKQWLRGMVCMYRARTHPLRVMKQVCCMYMYGAVLGHLLVTVMMQSHFSRDARIWSAWLPYQERLVQQGHCLSGDLLLRQQE